MLKEPRLMWATPGDEFQRPWLNCLPLAGGFLRGRGRQPKEGKDLAFSNSKGIPRVLAVCQSWL